MDTTLRTRRRSGTRSRSFGDASQASSGLRGVRPSATRVLSQDRGRPPAYNHGRFNAVLFSSSPIRRYAAIDVGKIDRMSLTLYVAHTGARLDADPAAFESLDVLRQWIANATDIPAADQILLTEKGRHVKLPTLLIEKEIYLYDRALFSTTGTSIEAPHSPLPEAFEPDQAPEPQQDLRDIGSFAALFRARRDWAFEIVRRCGVLADTADAHLDEQDIIERCILIATANHDSHIRGLEQKHAEAKSWFDQLAKEQEANLQNWQDDLAGLDAIPARQDFQRFFSGTDAKQENGRRRPQTLAAFVDGESMRKSAGKSQDVTTNFAQRLLELKSAITDVAQNYQELRDGISNSRSQHMSGLRDEPGRLMDEISAVAKKIAADYDRVATQSSVTQNIVKASSTSNLHSRNYLPSLREMCGEMSEAARRAVEAKNSSANSAVDRMRVIASIESAISKINSDIGTLDIPQEDLNAFEELAAASRVPFVYGSLLIEAVRRSEWIEKMKRDASTLAEEIAGYQEEEQRRRRKWIKSMSEILHIDVLEGKALGVEVNLSGEENGWPTVTRSELEEYLSALAQVQGFDQIVANLRTAVKELDKPTRQQIRHAKAFKAGSVHDAGLGRGSLMLRGEDEMRVLRDSNIRLEDELKAQKSRVRKLEGLLHGQSQLGRLSLASGFGPQTSSPDVGTPDGHGTSSSPKLEDDSSRRGSANSRRVSAANRDSQDAGLTRKVARLEAELLAEKAARADLEKETLAHQDDHSDARRQIEEANSIKKDIMENMEAQQKEFANERRSLEEELEKAKQRLEEVEDELDRVIGSRDHERVGTDNRLQSLIGDLDSMRKESADDMQKADDQIKSLREQLERRGQEDADRTAALVDIFSHLSSGDVDPPGDHVQLLSRLDDLARRSTDHARDLESAVALARSENESLQTTLDEHKAEASSLSTRIAELEADAKKFREDAMDERAKIALLETELSEERKRSKGLQDKLLDGENGSEALQRRIAEGENRAIRLSGQLAEAQSHANSLDVELSISEKKHSKLQAQLEAANERLEQRSHKAKDLTQRLYTQTDRLQRLLETLGFAITHQDDTMIIQRASKANASAVFSDPSMSLQRSVSTPVAPSKKMSEELDLSMLHWADKENVEDEQKKFQDYIAALDKFDLKVFSDAVAKRMRDIEHTARKWQKEARAYRDKSHRLHGEAHDKIAFRGFKEGDLALFLPTRNQVTRPWAAFNVGAPHYFLREQENHKLHNKEWLVARISKIEERVVDLSKSLGATKANSDRRSLGETSDGGASFEDDNPFDLSDGLRWYMLDAAEEKMIGAPFTPGLGKATVASARVDARAGIRIEKSKSTNDASKNLSKSLDSRRSSTNSKKSIPVAGQLKPDSDSTSGRSHLRTTSNAESLLEPPKERPEPARDATTENDVKADATSRPSSKVMPPPARSSQPNPEGGSTVSPAKSSRSTSESPTKRATAQGNNGGLWDSLWKFDVSLEGNERKEARNK